MLIFVRKNLVTLASFVKSKCWDGVKKYEITKRAKTSTKASASRFGKNSATNGAR